MVQAGLARPQSLKMRAMKPPLDAQLQARFAQVLDELERRANVAGAFVDKHAYRLLLATVWAEVVMDPGKAGLEEADLETLHDVLNARARPILGSEDAVRECFRFVNSSAGERAMEAARLNQAHKELLLYFSSMILDPEGHRKWMESVKHP